MLADDIMRADPAYIARVVALAEELAEAPHGDKGARYQAVAAELSVSVATLKRDVGEARGRQRKVRADAGRSVVNHAELERISAAMMGGYRANKKKILSLANAIEMLRKDGIVRAEAVDSATGEIRPVTCATVARALRNNVLHPEQLRRASPAVPLKSLHPNHCWQIDASISTLFYVPAEGGINEMAPGEFYKNKPQNFEKIKRERLTRYCITDHYSGMIFVTYVAGGESAANMAEAMIRCMVKRTDRGMHGAPLLLMTDPGSAPKSGAVGNLCRRLQIEIIINQAGNARAKGQVEKAHDLVETNFESGFKFTHVPGLAWINEQAARFCDWFNATRPLTRTGRPRLNGWMRITSDQLRVIDETTARQMLTARPQKRTVDECLRVNFNGRSWHVNEIPGVFAGEELAVTTNPFDKDAAFVVDVVPDGGELLHEIKPVEVDDAGFADDARVIGEGYRARPDTVADKNRKAIRRAMYEAPTDLAADKAERAGTPIFGGALDPYKKFDDLPAATPLPRRGTALSATAQVAALPEAPLTHFEAARRLAARGVAMDAEKNQRVREWYPDGVPESELAALETRLAGLTAAPAPANLRLVG